MFRFLYCKLKLIVILVALFSLAGCNPMVGPEQDVQTNYSLLISGITLGQTFVADYDGLSGVNVFLAPGTPGDGKIVLHLRQDVSSQKDLAVGRLPVQSITSPAYYRFEFSPQPGTRHQYLYAFMEIQGEGSVQVGITSGTAYLDGSLYANHLPFDAQTTFSLSYQPQTVWSDVFSQVVKWIGLLVVGVFLFILPGWAILSLMWSGWKDKDWAERSALAAGMSLALYPLLFLWTDLVGLHLGALYAWIPASAALVILGWKHRHSIQRLPINVRQINIKDYHSLARQVLPDIVLVIILCLVFLVRFWSVRNLDVPMWGDSYQHTLITQLMLDHGGLFDSWKPYAELDTLTYHFGFHAAAAVLGWVTQLSAPKSVLWTGQILNGLAVLALYPLAVRIGGNRRAGIGAVLVTGLLISNPMSYVNWGRYTQLAGQTVLLLVVYLLWEALITRDHDWKLTALTWIALSGLALTHYRVLIFALLFIPAYYLLEVRKGNLVVSTMRVFFIGLGSFILFLPWFFHVYGGKLLTILRSQMTTLPQSSLPGLVDEYNSIGSLFRYLPPWVWISLPLVVAWGLWQRKKGVTLVSAWWLLLLLAANPAWFNLPGTGTLSNFAVFIAAYIPAGVLVGAALGWGLDAFNDCQPGNRKWIPLIACFMLICFGLWGAHQRLGDVDIDQYSLVTRPDLRAAVWLKDNTGADARFVVNNFFSFMGTLVVGSDGGWWLPLLAERQTNLPPTSYGIEEGESSNYYDMTNELAAEIDSRGITDPQVIAGLVANGFTHVYIGQRQGQVNYYGPMMLDPAVLQANDHFRVIYQQDRVWIFQIVP
jgi:predicted small secreted protein